MRVRIGYCGGCNPRFDRAAVEERLRSRFPSIQFERNTAGDADAAVILCGCGAACADVTAACGVYGRFVLWQESAWEDLETFIDTIDKEMRNQV